MFDETAGAHQADRTSALFVLRMVTKTYSGVKALDQVDFDLLPGEVHVLFGENGAGKSTLINILVGTIAHDGGQMFYRGQPAPKNDWSPQVARAAGVSAVFQEFSLVPTMTVAENLFLGRELSHAGILDKPGMHEAAEQALARLSFAIPTQALAYTLSRAQQQMVEIAKALLGDVRVLILDEPTASLTEAETGVLFALIHNLRSQGVGIVYVSHRMKEIRRLADRITILRDGKKIDTVEAANCSDDELIQLMVGRPIGMLFPHIDHKPGLKLLEAKGLCLPNGLLQNVSIHVAAGEVVGMAGLVGGGKSEVARALFGLERLSSGSVWVDGEQVTNPQPERMLRKGVCYFPADRVAEGLALTRPVIENASITATRLPELSWFGLLNLRAEKQRSANALSTLNLQTRTGATDVQELSGGNRQKVMLARGLMRDTRVFVFDEPTVGIDVGAKLEIYQVIKHLAEQGAAVLLISSDLPEILHLCCRVYVVHRGRLVAHLRDDEIEEATVLRHFFPNETHEKELSTA